MAALYRRLGQAAGRSGGGVVCLGDRGASGGAGLAGSLGGGDRRAGRRGRADFSAARPVVGVCGGGGVRRGLGGGAGRGVLLSARSRQCIFDRRAAAGVGGGVGRVAAACVG